jgi:hypothetical protein
MIHKDIKEKKLPKVETNTPCNCICEDKYQAVKFEKEGEILKLYNQIIFEVDTLEDVVAELITKLNPILREIDKDVEGDTFSEEPTTPMGKSLQTLLFKLKDISYNLDCEILSKIEL